MGASGNVVKIQFLHSSMSSSEASVEFFTPSCQSLSGGSSYEQLISVGKVPVSESVLDTGLTQGGLVARADDHILSVIRQNNLSLLPALYTFIQADNRTELSCIGRLPSISLRLPASPGSEKPALVQFDDVHLVKNLSSGLIIGETALHKLRMILRYNADGSKTAVFHTAAGEHQWPMSSSAALSSCDPPARSCNRIVAVRRAAIPPYSSALVMCRVEGELISPSKDSNGVGPAALHFEPDIVTLGRRTLCASTSVVTTFQPHGQNHDRLNLCRIEVMNASPYKIHVRKDLTVGTLSECEVAHDVGAERDADVVRVLRRILPVSDVQMTSMKSATDAVAESFSPMPMIMRTEKQSRELDALLTSIDKWPFELVEDFDVAQAERFRSMLRSYAFMGLFAGNSHSPGASFGPKYSIEVQADAKPQAQKLRRYAPLEREAIESNITEWLQSGFISPSRSPWSCNVVLVRKRDGSLRLCCDYRGLNSVTVKQAAPLPLIDDLLSIYGNHKWHTALDLAAAFQQVEMADESRKFTAFSCHLGQFEWARLPFGLVNGPAFMQALLSQALLGLNVSSLATYIDDIRVSSTTLDGHFSDLEKVFDRLLSSGFSLKLSKCDFFKRSIKYLGHVISEEGVVADPAKTAAIKLLPSPTNRHELQSVLGTFAYYRKYIARYSVIASPLTDLLKSSQDWVWSEKQDESFAHLKRLLCDEPIMLRHPQPDGQFVVYTDGSCRGIAASLAQVFDASDGDKKKRREHVISYDSRKLRGSEARYGPCELEALAVVFATERYRPYLLGRFFTVVTDHSALRSVFKSKECRNSRVARWALQLQEYQFDVVYRAGTANHVDHLSRYPVDEAPAEYDYVTKQSEQWHALWEDPLPPPVRCDGLHDSALKISSLRVHKIINAINVIRINALTRSQRVKQSESSSLSSSLSSSATSSDGANLAGLASVDDEKKEEQFVFDPEDVSVMYPQAARDPNAKENESVSAYDLTRQTIRDAQCSDPFSCSMVRVLLNKAHKEDLDEVWPWLENTTMFVLCNGLLYVDRRYGRSKDAKKRRELADHEMAPWMSIYLPESCRAAALALCHDDPISGGHYGSIKTYYRCADRFWWPTISIDCEHYSRSCHVCATYKYDRHPGKWPVGTIPKPVSNRVFSTMHVDLMGPTEPTASGNRYTMTVTCDATGWAEAFAIKDKQALTVAVKLFEEVFARYSFPDIVLSDQGSEFMNSVFVALKDYILARHLTTTAFHPPCNGENEAFNKSLGTALKLLSYRRPVDWDQLLPAALLLYRTTAHSRIHGLQPFVAVFKDQPRLPIDLLLAPADVGDQHDLQKDLQSKLQFTSSLLNEAFELNEAAKAKRNQKLPPLPDMKQFRIGDTVFLLNESPARLGDQEASKFRRAKYTGPWRVVRTFNDGLNVQIRRSNPSREKTVHASKLKKVEERDSRFVSSEENSLSMTDFQVGDVIMVKPESRLTANRRVDGQDSSLWLALCEKINESDRTVEICWFRLHSTRRMFHGQKCETFVPDGPYRLDEDWHDVASVDTVMCIFDRSKLINSGYLAPDALQLAFESYQDHQLNWPKQTYVYVNLRGRKQLRPPRHVTGQSV
jgi:hypothetical protein